ncbi:MAG: hypothetical protein R3261_08225 [Alphaproteobacteria bacterium]|nr:hypothetical protein [Alphaproteobacteria bacterium]
MSKWTRFISVTIDYDCRPKRESNQLAIANQIAPKPDMMLETLPSNVAN